MIIDIHAHCFPDQLAAKAIKKLEQRGGIKATTNGTVQDLKRSMKEAGINQCVIQHVATKPEQTKDINRWAAAIQDHEIVSFGSIHPQYPKWQEEIDFLVQSGIKGIKFHPYHQDFFIDDQVLYPLYEKVFSAGLFILFHMGADLCTVPYNPCTPKQLINVIQSFPGALIIAAHMGGFRYWQDVEKYLIAENIYLDTSFSFQELGIDNMTRMIQNHGSHRVLFGSDSPWGDQSEEVQNIMSLDLSPDMLDNVLWKNASRILGLLKLSD